MTSASRALPDLWSLDFHERRWSFVARSDGPETLFVKVPKASSRTAFAAALGGSEEQRLARNEFETLRSLAAYDTDNAAVVRAVALLENAPAEVTRYVDGLTPLSAVLDHDTREWSPLIRRLGGWLRNVHANEPGKNIDGFNLSNVGVDGDRLVLFDPNELLDGHPTDDLARFCVSLLSRGYESGRLPSARGLEQSWALLAGYGLDAIDGDSLDRALARWISRLSDEIDIAARWSFPCCTTCCDLLPPSTGAGWTDCVFGWCSEFSAIPAPGQRWMDGTTMMLSRPAIRASTQRSLSGGFDLRCSLVLKCGRSLGRSILLSRRREFSTRQQEPENCSTS